MKRKAWACLVAYAVVSSCLSATGVADDQVPATEPSQIAKTGEFTTTFADRSPESSIASLNKRYAMSPGESATDYNLAASTFTVYVPTKYDPASPPGIVFWADALPTMPEEFKPVLDAANLIFIAPAKWQADPWVQSGAILDAAYDIRKQYTVDKDRIYLVDVEDHHFVSLTVADVYTGIVSVRFVVFPEKFVLSPKLWLTADDPHTPSMAEAKKRPWVVLYSSKPSTDDYQPQFPAAMKRDGFAQVLGIKVDPAEIATPNIQSGWFKTAIAFLDRNQGKPKPVISTPATRPAASPAETAQQVKFQIDMAKAYISSGKNDLAKAKLTDLIAKYPDDPSIGEAKALLAQIGQ